jgi:hypothetical protein
MTVIYPAVAAALLEKSDQYRKGLLTLDSLKRAVWQAADEIVAVEERGLRGFLQKAEGRLDMIEHTRDRDAVFDETLRVVTEIEERLREYLSRDAGQTER